MGKNRDIRDITETDILEFDLCFYPRERLSLRRVKRLLVETEELLKTLDTTFATLDLRERRGEILGRGNHEDEHHDVGNEKFGGDAGTLDNHERAKKEDTNNDAVAEKIADGRRKVNTAVDPGAETGITTVGLAKTPVGKVDGRVSLDDFEADDTCFHKRHKERIAFLQFDGIATETMGYTRNDEDHNGKHAENKEGEFQADIKQHGYIKHNTNHSSEEELKRT